MRGHVRLDTRGLAAAAESNGMKDALREAAEAVKDNVDRMGIRVEGEPGDIALPVEADDDSVAITHAAGLAVQAKHGALTRAAAEAGLKVGES